MSGQCLSPNDAGHALTPATHRCLGEPLPHQQANRMQAPPQTESHLWSGDVIRYYLQFPAAIPDPGVGTYTLLSLSPLSVYRSKLLARLACLIHAANVHSEPESNPSIDWLAPAIGGCFAALQQATNGHLPLRGFICSLFHSRMQTKNWNAFGAGHDRAGRNRKRSTTKLSKIFLGCILADEPGSYER